MLNRAYGGVRSSDAAKLRPAQDHEFYERLGLENAGNPPDVWDYATVRRGTI
jgi:hypothetical protein